VCNARQPAHSPIHPSPNRTDPTQTRAPAAHLRRGWLLPILLLGVAGAGAFFGKKYYDEQQKDKKPAAKAAAAKKK
jgi:hypothetical protein